MNSDYPSNRQWTIRMVPWFTFLILIILCVVDIGVIIVVEQARLFASLLLIVFPVGLATFEWVSCTLDQDLRKVTLIRSRLLRKEQYEFSFDDVHTIAVLATSDSDSTTYNVVFVLKSCDVIPLTKYTTSYKNPKDKLAQKFVTFINHDRPSSIILALDGRIRVEKKGEMNGIPWRITYISTNDSPYHTLWHSMKAQFLFGFIIIIPAGRFKPRTIPGGVFGSAVRFIYKQYLDLLDIEISDLPDFDNAKILPGNELGLDNNFSIVTNDIMATKSWFTSERVNHLKIWMQTNPLHGSHAATDPHIAITNQGLNMSFRGKYNMPAEIDSISKLGCSLV